MSETMEINRPLPSLINRLYQDNNNLGRDLSTPDNNSPEPKSIASSTDTKELSLSIRSQKLNDISKAFFNGPIASKDIAALSQSLYENGFINNQELSAMGKDTTEQSSITQSKHFISSFMFEASKQGDTQTLAMLDPIEQALTNMDAAATQKQRQTEVVALDNAEQLLTYLQDRGADEGLIKAFEEVVDVLSTLDTLRKNDQINQGVSEYESIQSEYDSLFSEPQNS